MGGKVLVRAKRLFNRKKYPSVIRLLEPQVFRFRENGEFYFLLGASCFYSGDISGAGTYLKRVLDLERIHVQAMLYLAVIYLRQHRNQDAIEVWLAILEEDPSNKYAKRGLDLLKRGAHNRQIVDDALSDQKVSQLLPGRFPYLPVFLTAAVAVLIVLPGILFLTREISIPQREPRNETVQAAMQSESAELTTDQGSFQFVLTEKEIEQLLEEANSRFNNFEDNEVQKIVNRLLYSNASRSVKDKALVLEKYLTKPDFTNLSNTIAFSEIAEYPLLYNKCYIRWKGKISNLSREATAIRFDFLVGYHDNKVLEGIVPVTLDFAASLGQGDPVELIGRVEADEQSFSVRGTSIRPIAPE